MNTIFQTLRHEADASVRSAASRAIAVLGARGVFYALSAALVLSGAVLLLQLALSLSGLTRTEDFVGPFAAETEGSDALIVHLNQTSKLRRVLGTGGDSLDDPHRSALSIAVNGVPLGSPHTLHDKIRNDKTARGAFSHWGDQVIFSLPHGVSNSKDVELRVVYPLLLGDKLVGRGTTLLAFSLLLLALRKRILDPIGFDTVAVRWGNFFFLSSRAAWSLLFAAAVMFLATITYGFADGYYLPNTAVFSYFSWAAQLAKFEPGVPYVILGYAMIGTVLAWIASLSGEASAHGFHQSEQQLVASFDRFGLAFLLGLFLFSIGGTWAGIPRPQDLSGNAVGGLVPFSDAMDHFSQTFYQTVSGHWGSFASRRPFAAALRGAGMFLTGYSNALFLGMQTVLMALATFIATRSIMRWRGLWAGLTFLGLTMILVRPYLPTNLTEPLGILLALASIPYFICAIRGGATATKGVSLLLTCWALIVRMGNMFFIPALGLWIFLSSEKTRRARRNAVLIVLASIGFVFAFNSVLSKLYGSGHGAVGANFAHTFCGLTHNGNWTLCGQLYADDLKPLAGDEAKEAELYYRRGLEKLAAEPSVFIGRVGSGIWNFLLNIPAVLLQGYTGSIPPSFPIDLWFFVAIYGLGRVAVKGMPKREKTFWTLFVASLLGSAGIVFFDDGIRVLSASFPLLFALVASGFSANGNRNQAMPVSRLQENAMKRIGGVLIVLTCIACLVLPWIAYRLDVTKGQALKAVATSPGQETFFASRYMAGFLVMPDGAQLPKDAPAMHLKAFTEIVMNSNIEQYEKLVTPVPPPAPFGVVAAPGLSANGGALLIVPSKVLFDRDAIGWKMSFSGGNYWRRVSKAKPIQTDRTAGDRR
jgi:preprotein translocase subunit SecG